MFQWGGLGGGCFSDGGCFTSFLSGGGTQWASIGFGGGGGGSKKIVRWRGAPYDTPSSQHGKPSIDPQKLAKCAEIEL